MKPFALLFISVCFYLSTYSQLRSEVVYVLMPAREFEQTSLIKNMGIKKEVIYSYKKRDKNKDSFQVRINFFDSLGNCIERDEFAKESTAPVEITNYSYTNNMLVRAEKQSVAGHSYATISTYDYDSAGNRISQKNYVGEGDTSFKFQDEKKWEYDSAKHITSLYYKHKWRPTYKSNSYHYKDNKLQEAITFMPDGSVFFSNLFDYDTILNRSSVWVDNTSERTLKFEEFYNKQGQLVKELNYVGVSFYRKFSTDEIQYLPTGLAYKEVFIPAEDEISLYFKHYYYQEF